MRILLLTTVVLLGLPSISWSQSVELYDYVIKPGDSCVRVASRELGDRKGYKIIHKHNPKLGPLPHLLKPGKTLKLPRKTLRPDGRLGDKRGQVRFRSPDDKWGSANRGMDLFRHWRVNTREEATAAIDFKDRSQLRLRERTIVILYGPSRKKARRITERAFLVTGALRTRLSRPGGPPLAIASATAMVEFGRGSALMAVDDKKAARVANHGGNSVRVRSSKGAKSVDVKSGFGTKVEQGKDPSPPQPLPDPPIFDKPGQVLPIVGGTGRLVAAWQPASKAVRYRVSVSPAAAPNSPIAAGEVGRNTTSIAVAGVPAGTYLVTVASIDADGFEGRPSRAFRLKLASLDGAVGGAIASDVLLPLTSAEPTPVRAAPGATLSVPPTLSCVLMRGERRIPVTRLPASGTVSLECIDGQGTPLEPIKIAIGPN